MRKDTFFSKDPEKAIEEIRDVLYDRLQSAREFLQKYGVHPHIDYETRAHGYDTAIRDEIAFLEQFLNKLERSI